MLSFFHPVCLFVYEQDISKSYGRIRTKLGGQVWVCCKDELIRFGWRSRSRYENLKNCFVDSSPLRGMAKNDISHDVSKRDRIRTKLGG